MDNLYGSLNGKKVYAFGDSIVYGHYAPERSFMRMIADEYGMKLNMLAVNGATVVTADSYAKESPDEKTTDNYIINQIKGAPEEAPDIIVFDGYTNDAYGDSASDRHNPVDAHIDIMKNIGDVQGKDADSFDTSTFCGGFEKIIHDMREKWGNIPIVFVTIHKSGGRDWDIQCRLRELALKICSIWGVYAADVFDTTDLDTRDAAQMKRYIMDGAGSHPNEAACREFYMPVVCEMMDKALSLP